MSEHPSGWAAVIDLTTEVTEQFLNGLPRDVFKYLELLDQYQNHASDTQTSSSRASKKNESAARGMAFLRDRCSQGKAYVAKTSGDPWYLHPKRRDIWDRCYHLVLTCLRPADENDAMVTTTTPAWAPHSYKFPPLLITNIRAPPPPEWEDKTFEVIGVWDLSVLVAFMYRDIAHPAGHLPYLTSLNSESLRHHRDQFFYIEGFDLLSEGVLNLFRRRPPVRRPLSESLSVRLWRRLSGSPNIMEKPDYTPWNPEPEESIADQPWRPYLWRLWRRKRAQSDEAGEFEPYS